MFEWSYGANNDLQLLFKDLRLFDFALICLVVFNMAHGPDRDEGVRHEQFKDMVSILVKNFTPETATVPGSLWPHVARAQGCCGY
jgi:hypothetical protein